MTSSELTAKQRELLLLHIDAWRKDLLPTDRRQRALYFTHTKSASLEIVGPSLERIVDLATSQRARFEALVDEQGEPRETSRERLALSNLLMVDSKTDTSLATALRTLDRKSRQTFADSGFWTLYLGLGMLRWIDPDDGKAIDSPLLLVPVSLHRDGLNEPFRLERTEDDVVLNPVLSLKLETSFDLHLNEVDVEDVDVRSSRAAVQALITGRPGWRVDDRCVMTIFSFHKEAMYRDLNDHASDVSESPLIQLLALGPDAPSAGSYGFDVPRDETLDTEHPAEGLLSILDADSSQRKCIIAAREGKSFVMDGPPGTGKSQTIANIIVELMSAGKSVLFVSEKAAALDVVRKRLAQAQLDEFLLELHSHLATRKAVVAELDRALTSRITASYRFTGTDLARLRSAREELNNYAIALNEQRSDLERSVHQIVGRLSELHELRRFHVASPYDFAELSADRLAEIRSTAEDLQRYWRPVIEGRDFLWHDLRSSDMEDAVAGQFSRAAQRLADQSAALWSRAQAIDDDLVLSLPRHLDAMRHRERLLELAAARPESVADTWLSADLSPVRARVADLQHKATKCATQILAVEEPLTEGVTWRDVDLGLAPVLKHLVAEGQTSWRPPSSTDATAYAELLDFLSSPQQVETINDDARYLAQLFGMDVTRVSLKRAWELAEMGKLASATSRPDATWLNPNMQAALTESTRILDGLVQAVREREASLGTVFTPQALDLDLPGLHLRFRDVHKGLGKMSKQARADKKLLKSATVTGKVNKATIARLEEAVTWQAAHQSLTAGEGEHAGRLGAHYRGTSTDFDRLSSALTNAQTAIRLAGADLNAAALAQQISADATPEPHIAFAAERIQSTSGAWASQARRHLGGELDALSSLPLEQVLTWLRERGDEIRPGVAALHTLSGLCGKPTTPVEAVGLLSDVAVISDLVEEFARHHDADQSLLGGGFNGRDTNWGALESAVAWAQLVQDVVGGPLTPTTAHAIKSPTLLASDIRPLIESWTLARDAVREAFDGRRAEELRQQFDANVQSAAELAANMAATAVSDIADWCSFSDARSRLDKFGLAEVVHDMQNEVLDREKVADAVERCVLAAWVDNTIRLDARLTKFRSADRDAVVADFRELDRKLVNESHATVATRCNALRPQSLNGTAAQRIRREAQKKSRHIPIRKLLDETGELVQQLKPCFMMSPLSVSQFLPPGLEFDAVIFDEASQVLPSDAVNCVYRGKQLIVAGDRKQLPPTSFFARSGEDESDEDAVEADVFDSLLDMAKAAGALPSLPLRWHYRSQHESLITFSNLKFYEGSLFTFPGARYEAPDLGVAHYLVEGGVYRRGSSRDNAAEAELIVERVLFHRRAHPENSLGVVTFSSAQEDAIVRALEAHSREHPELAEMLEDNDRLDGFFVKNLENVQGDERDIILFSVGYGPDENGKPSNNFGPINKAGGWRRLNVAITRARRRVEVISSFTAGQMLDSENESVRFLRAYIDYAARGLEALATDLTGSLGEPESVFEEDVLRVIASLGYEGVPQVGSAGYRIDIGVRHPTKPGEYLIGVECDGAAYHSSKSARDRDRLREEVLSRLGWHLHRIWGISWYRDREAQILRLKAALDAAMLGPINRQQTTIIRESTLVVDEIDEAAPPDWAVPYRIGGQAQRLEWVPDAIEALPQLRRYFEGLLGVEAPVHQDVVFQRARADLDIGRIGWRIKENFERALNSVRVAGSSVSLGPDNFYRIDGQVLVDVRVPDGDYGTRDVAQVPSEELRLAVAAVVRDAVLISPSDLQVAVARIFGWRRLGTDIQRAMDRAIATLAHEGEIVENSAGHLRPASNQ